MKKKVAAFFSTTLIIISGILTSSYAQTTGSNNALNNKQRSIVAIATLTAQGDLEPLKKVLNEGLDAGLTVNEIKEELIHMYAYTGFPRSLNGIITFMDVIDERKAKGINDPAGEEAKAVATDRSKYEIGRDNLAVLSGVQPPAVQTGYAAFTPTIEVFLKEHLFADIFERGIFDYQTRELITVSALASLGNVNAQLRSHMNISLRNGLTETQLRELIAILESTVGKKEAANATEVLNGLLASR